MTSYIYLATAFIDHQPIMKIGKSNHTGNRQQQLKMFKVEMYTIRECIDETTAFRREREAREFARCSGAQQFRNTRDWFYFDENIFDTLAKQFFPECTKELDDDLLFQFQLKEQKLLKNLAMVQAQLTQAETRITILNREAKERAEIHHAEIEALNEARRAEIEALNEARRAEIGELRERIGMYRGALNASGIDIKFEE